MASSTKLPKSKKGKFQHIPCNLCGKDDYSIIYEAIPYEADPKDLFSASGHDVIKDQVVKCRNCGLVYVNPRFKGEEIVKGYSEGIDKDYVSQSEGRMATFTDGVHKIEKVLGRKGKLLDVGAAAGFFIKAAKQEGWDEYGVEPNKWLAKYGREKLKVNNKAGTLREMKFKSKFFDAVTLWDVLEHVPDPTAELIEARRVLKDDGILAINYPNFGSSLAKLFGRKWWFLLSVHIYYFTPSTIRKILERNGFEIVYEKRHFQKLNIGYLAYRIRPYGEFVYKLVSSFVTALGLQDKQMTYYASQSLVLARKKKKGRVARKASKG